jgi:hypothetical protein
MNDESRLDIIEKKCQSHEVVLFGDPVTRQGGAIPLLLKTSGLVIGDEGGLGVIKELAITRESVRKIEQFQGQVIAVIVVVNALALLGVYIWTAVRTH